MRDRQMHRARVVANVAATAIALACGTNVRPSRPRVNGLEDAVAGS